MYRSFNVFVELFVVGDQPHLLPVPFRDEKGRTAPIRGLVDRGDDLALEQALHDGSGCLLVGQWCSSRCADP